MAAVLDRVVAVRLARDVASVLEDAARRQGVSLSTILRRAISNGARFEQPARTR